VFDQDDISILCKGVPDIQFWKGEGPGSDSVDLDCFFEGLRSAGEDFGKVDLRCLDEIFDWMGRRLLSVFIVFQREDEGK
jgi:hypothetical protein